MSTLSRAVLASFFLSVAYAAPVAQAVVVTTDVQTVYATLVAGTAATSVLPANFGTPQETQATSSQPKVAAVSKVAPLKTHHGGKRGLAYNDVSLTNPFTSSKHVGWAYNWGSSTSGLSSHIEYVPMLWGANSVGSWHTDATNAIASGSRHLLGFNEPDNTGQANMSPQEAATLWKQYMEPFSGKAWLGSPAVTNGGGSMGLSWLSSFMNACDTCNVHFIALHWYASVNNVQYFKDYFTQAHAQFPGKHIHITEFGTTDGTPDQINSFLQQVLPWLDSQPYIWRYAYFWDAEGSLISNGALSTYGKTYSG